MRAATAAPRRLCGSCRHLSSTAPRGSIFSSLFARGRDPAAPSASRDAPPKTSFQPPLALARLSAHRPPTDRDASFLRRVSDGAQPGHLENPGARVHENLLSATEMEALENAARDLCASHGIDLIDPHARAVYEAQMAFLRLPPEVNMLRVTGRPERADQRRGEWGYADDFDESKLPHAIRTLVDRIREQPGLALGKPRDVTINQRRHRFFRLDPHIDPQDDGGSIFICSVTAGTVLTLSPLDEWKRHEAQIVAERDQKDPEWAKGLEWIRSTRSYTPHDIDVLLPLGSVAQLSDDARWTWTHATRLGVEIPVDEGGKTRWRLADWWGDRTRTIERREERISVVVAFGDREYGFPAREF